MDLTHMDPNVALLQRELGLSAEEARAAVRAYRQPLPAAVVLSSGLRVKLLPGAVSLRVARGMVRNGWAQPIEQDAER